MSSSAPELPELLGTALGVLQAGQSLIESVKRRHASNLVEDTAQLELVSQRENVYRLTSCVESVESQPDLAVSLDVEVRRAKPQLTDELRREKAGAKAGPLELVRMW